MRIYLRLALVLFFSMVTTFCFSQQIIFQESFESASFPPTGWAIVNEGGGNNFTSFFNTALAFDGQRSMTYTSNSSQANAWALTPAITLNSNPVYISFYVRARANLASERLRFTVGNGGGTAFQTTILADSSNINYTTYRKWSFVFTPGTSGIHYFGFNCLSPGLSGSVHIDSLTIRQDFVSCTGTPAGGTTVSSTSSVCEVTTPFNLSVNGSTSGVSNLSYQWQSSPDNVTYTNIAGATDATLSAQSISASTWYRRSIVCSGPGGSSSLSTPVQVTLSAPVYGSLPFNEGFENGWQNSCAVRDRPGPNWRNLNASGNQSWRRNDDAAAGLWSSGTIGAYSPESSEGSNSARFHSSQSFNVSGELQLYLDLSGNTTKRLSFDYINIPTFNQTDSLRVLLSTDGGLTRNPIGTVLGSASVWTASTIDLNVNSATAILYFKAYGTNQNGNSDIGIDRVQVINMPLCSGAPVAGTIAVINAAGCGSQNLISLRVTGGTENQSGLTYQWQESSDSLNWQNITGATGATLINHPYSNTGFFRRGISCGSNVAYTPGIKVLSTTVQYASLPFSEDFENAWVNGCTTRDIPGANWLNTPSTGNNSWRKHNDGLSGNWTNANIGLYNPTGYNSTSSARFHSYDATPALGAGNLDLYLNCSGNTATKQLNFAWINLNGIDTLGVLISTDGGASFRRIGTGNYTLSSVWSPVSLDFSSNSSQTVIRFSARGDFGNSDIGLDKISVISLISCTGTPVAGSAAFTTQSCAALPVRLGVSGSTVFGPGISYQWQRSSDSLNWMAEPGATNDSLFLPATARNFLFRRLIRCNTDSVASTPVRISISSNLVAATIPFFESFENWTSECSTLELPGSPWRNTPVSGNTSWRRSDQGSSAGWSNSTLGNYTPTATSGSFSARFHSYDAQAFLGTGNLDLYLDCSSGSADKVLRFSHINLNGNDTLGILLSTDGGVSFSRLAPAPIGFQATGWRSFSYQFSSNSSQTVIRFSARGDFGNSDIGLDSVYVFQPALCSGTPVPSVVTGPAQVCNGYNFTLTASGFPAVGTVSGKEYQWQASTNGGTAWTNLINATNPASVTVVQLQTTRYRLKDSCTNSGGVAYSNELLVTIRPDTALYLTLGSGYTQNFENWASRCVSNEIPDTNWIQRNVSGDSSWRRNDQGLSAGWNNSFSGNYFPTSSQGNYSARFHSKSGSFILFGGGMDFYVNASTVPQIEIGFQYQNYLDNDSLMVLVSYNGGQSFIRIAALGSKSTTGFSAQRFWVNNPGNRTIIRLMGRSANIDEGGTDIGIDEFYVLPRSCPVPAGLAYNKAAGVASWQTAANAADYTWELRTPGTIPGSGPAGLLTGGRTAGNSVLLSAQPQGDYLFAVRTNCNGNDSSVWNFISINNRLNDECSGARNLTMNTTSAVLSSLADSTNVSTGSGQSCSSGLPVKDVWFRFVPLTSQVKIKLLNRQLIGSGTGTLNYEVYQTINGSCPVPGSDFTQACTSDDSITLNLVVSRAAYIRVYAQNFSGINVQQYKFNLSVHQPDPPPVCTQNVSPAPNATGVPVTGTSLRWRKAAGATNYDVYVRVLPSGSFFYFNSTSDTSLLLSSALQYNTEYRFYVVPVNSSGSASGCASNFTIFTTESNVIPAPANDNCNTLATYTLPVSPVIYDTTGTPVFTTRGATQSVNSASCYGGIDDDVWFSFIATGSSHLIRVIRTDASQNDYAIVGYSGGCGALNTLACNTNGPLAMNSLVPGQRYTLRVYTPFTTTAFVNSFKMVVSPVPPVPVNDNCNNAALLTGTTPSDGTTLGATSSSQGGVSCNSNFINPQDDVWYRFVPQVSGSANIVLNNTGPAEFNPVMAVYSGSNCNVLSLVACANSTVAGGNETLTLNSLVAGNTYYVRIFSNFVSTIEGGNFTLVYNGSTLPASLLSFSGQVHNGEHLLEWITAGEHQNKGFGIEYSINGGTSFRTAGFVASAAPGGISNQELRYQFVYNWQQQVPDAKTVWYRLVQTDLNGQKTYSRLISLNTSPSSPLLSIQLLHPNPARDIALVTFGGTIPGLNTAGASLVITDMRGRTVSTEKVAPGARQQRINLQNLVPGQYLVRLVCIQGCQSAATMLRKE